jgi:hypothetical protein
MMPCTNIPTNQLHPESHCTETLFEEEIKCLT